MVLLGVTELWDCDIDASCFNTDEKKYESAGQESIKQQAGVRKQPFINLLSLPPSLCLPLCLPLSLRPSR